MKNNFLSILLATTVIAGGTLATNTYGQENVPEDAKPAAQEIDRAQMHKQMAEKMAEDRLQQQRQSREARGNEVPGVNKGPQVHRDQRARDQAQKDPPCVIS